MLNFEEYVWSNDKFCGGGDGFGVLIRYSARDRGSLWFDTNVHYNISV